METCKAKRFSQRYVKVKARQEDLERQNEVIKTQFNTQMANDMRQQLGKDAAGKSDDEVNPPVSRKGRTGYYPNFINAYL